jgi:hypothetical protein
LGKEKSKTTTHTMQRNGKGVSSNSQGKGKVSEQIQKKNGRKTEQTA